MADSSEVRYRPGVSVPCFWPDCGRQATGLDGVASHLKHVHGVTGFGCPNCDFRHTEKNNVRLHIKSRHPNESKQEPVSATASLALHYRRLYREQDPRAKDIPDGAFWSRYAKKPPEGTCSQCKNVITPYTGKNIIQHLPKDSTAGKLQPDLDDLVLTNVAGSSLGDMIGEEVEIEEEEASDDFIDVDGYDDADDTCGKEAGLQGDNKTDETAGEGQGGMQETKASKLVKTTSRRDFPVVLLDQFSSCIDNSSIDEVKTAFEANETRNIDGGKHRINKKLPLDTKLDPEKFVYAILTPGGWHCKVPQCCAVLENDFAMDLHLNAHGDMILKNWYCGEPTCNTGYEKVYHTFENFESHINTEHLESKYSFAAARRAPKQEVLVSYLMTRLKVIQQKSNSTTNDDDECVPASTVVATSLRLTEEDKAPDDIRKATRACQRMRHFLETDARVAAHQSYTTTEGDDCKSAQDAEFQQHCDGPYEGSSLPSADLPPMVPQYIVSSIYGDFIAFERAAIDYVNLYRRICSILGTNDTQKLRREIDLAVDGQPEDDTKTIEQQERTSKEVPCQEDNKSKTQSLRTRFTLICPWPQCEHNLTDAFEWAARQRISLHLLTEHLRCIWQCPEKGCEHCAYLSPVHLERHRMHCHVGSPLQCGHHDCNRVFLNQIHESRGHIRDNTLRAHFEKQFNLKLQDPHEQAFSSNTESINETDTNLHQLPSESEYRHRFSGKSSLFLSPKHRAYRQARNLKFLSVYSIKFEDILIQGSMACAGFWYGNRHFSCADSISLGLDTAMLIFVPALLVFTVASTCDHCVYVMSLIARPYAELPLPFQFGRRTGLMNKRRRVGIGAEINDHASFLQVFNEQRLPVPPMAMKYKTVKQLSCKKIFIVDFESVRISDRNVPLKPTEITVRDGKGAIIISCRINKEGVTNAEFEKELRDSGFVDPLSFRSARRIRGGPEIKFPSNAKTPKAIVDILCAAGLNPDCLWVEYSAILFDRKCMEVLIRESGHSVQSILPPPAQCWTVFHDFSRSLPGLSSYRLGDVAKLLIPDRPEYKRLHYSDADTAVLYHFLESWIYVYGRQE